MSEQPAVKWYDENEPKIQKKWRPAIAWMYIGICLFDFVLGPVIMLVFFNKEWTPSTVVNNGIFHWTMGAILGVYTFGRSAEKIAGMRNTVKEIIGK